MSENKTQKVSLEYYLKDKAKLQFSFTSIIELIRAGKSVPAGLVEEFFLFFETPLMDRNEELSRRKKVPIEQAIEFFNGMKHDYAFEKVKIYENEFNWPEMSGKAGEPLVPGKRKEKNSITFSLEDLIRRVYDLVVTKDEINLSDQKTRIQFIKKVHGIVDKYISNVYSTRKYSFYKRTVISAFICAQFGIYKTKEQHNDAGYVGYLHKQICRNLRGFKSEK